MASLNTQSRRLARKQQIRPLAGSLLALAIGFGVATRRTPTTRCRSSPTRHR